MQSDRDLVRRNLLVAKRIWPNDINNFLIRMLKALTHNHQFSVECGDLLLLRVGWYVTHTGLIRLAVRRRCQGIHIDPVPTFSDPKVRRYAFKAIVFKSPQLPWIFRLRRRDPSNVSFLVHGAEMRVAETVPSTAHFEKPMASAYARLKKSGLKIETRRPYRNRRNSRPPPQSKGTYALPYGIGCIRSSVSMSSTRIWSSLMPLTSAGSKLCVRPLANRLRISSLTLPSGLRKIAMPCSAS